MRYEQHLKFSFILSSFVVKTKNVTNHSLPPTLPPMPHFDCGLSGLIRVADNYVAESRVFITLYSLYTYTNAYANIVFQKTSLIFYILSPFGTDM